MQPDTHARTRRRPRPPRSAAARRERRHRLEGVLSQYGITAGELGAASGQTIMVALLPVLLAEYTRSALWIGFAVGGEGIFALFVPLVVGALSDRLRPGLVRRFGRRSLFLLASSLVMALALVVAPFLEGYWALAAAAFVFFAALHAYFTPLWALMVDAVPDERRGRVQGVRGVLRSGGLAYGLVAGGLLHAIWRPLPFLVAALLVVVTTGVTWMAARASGRDLETRAKAERPSIRDSWHELRANPAARWLLVANAAWNGAVDGIRPYIFLFAVAALGLTVAQTSLGLSLLVAGLAVGSVVLGRLGDRHGRDRVLRAGVAITVVAFAGGFFVRDIDTAVAVLVLAGLGASAMLALPYPVFAKLVGERAIGQLTGVFVLSVSLGRIVAPMLVGVAIDLGRGLLPEARGYPFMWLAAAVLAAIGWVALKLSARRATAMGHVRL